MAAGVYIRVLNLVHNCMHYFRRNHKRGLMEYAYAGIQALCKLCFFTTNAAQRIVGMATAALGLFAHPSNEPN